MSAILPGLQAFSSAFNRIAMKKLLYILAGLGLAACTSDIEELPEVGPQPGREVALTGISGTASRTQFVPGDGTEIQFQWSTGDRIWAGGVQSAEAGTDGNVADFGFTNLPGAAPYRIYYNMTGTDAEAVVPTEQRQAEPGKLQLGPNGDFGYATTDSEGRFTLSHATAYVWFNPWSQDVKEKLVSVTLAATDASTVLTGTRTFDGTGFSDATDANNAVTLSFGKEGVELPATSSTASVFAAAVVYPADCSAEEIHVTYTFADGSVYTETKTGRNFEAGRIYRLTTEITKRDGGSLEIQGLEDSDEPVCMKYGASEAYALTAGGWIPTVEMTSAPAGWTADFEIDNIGSGDEVTGKGLFITNEGNFMYGNASLSYYDPEKKHVENEVFARANAIKLGDVAQSMVIRNGIGWIVVNNSGVIYAIDINTFKEVGRITGFTSPRYIHFLSDEKAYVTQIWDPRIYIVNPKTYQITGYVETDMDFETGSTEQMVQYDKYVFTNCWSYQNRILVIDTETDKVCDQITVGIQPTSLVMDKYNKIWTVTDGGYEGSPYGHEAPSLYCIDAATRKIEKQFKFKFGDWPSEVQLNGTRDTLYFINKAVWRLPVTADKFPVKPFLPYNNTLYYGLTINPVNSEVYIADAIDYVQNGVVLRYSPDGELLDEFYVGIIPGAFCWR